MESVIQKHVNNCILYVVSTVVGTGETKQKLCQAFLLLSVFASTKVTDMQQSNPIYDEIVVLLAAHLIHAAMHAKLVLDSIHAYTVLISHVNAWMTIHGIGVTTALTTIDPYEAVNPSLHAKAVNWLYTLRQLTAGYSEKYDGLCAKITRLARSLESFMIVQIMQNKKLLQDRVNKEKDALAQSQIDLLTYMKSMQNLRKCRREIETTFKLAEPYSFQQLSDNRRARKVRSDILKKLFTESRIDRSVWRLIYLGTKL